jgi:hypothetical protein
LPRAVHRPAEDEDHTRQHSSSEVKDVANGVVEVVGREFALQFLGPTAMWIIRRSRVRLHDDSMLDHDDEIIPQNVLIDQTD